ncbi:lysophospholipid acyltransferase family protein [Halocynthiibacter sp. C4]|uniref:lysophospholipid acyltransferase family protein n=1 Tax=Halocynthiibacter sp. C4 TaxID=2992758 RepID=UPI00237A8369|nr:lysophospholipid acyltransferase family protein [Halocynthiibacter sp. C4]MDE0589673.1 lysophospholipid acyltransferase family protein [Halocynthiibacter sp. C4]
MTPTWTSDKAPTPVKIGVGGVVRAVLRGVPLLLLTSTCLILMLLLRLIEQPIYGVRRPFTPYLTLFVCRNAFRILGMGYSAEGEIMRHKGAVVANHGSWLDIFALNAQNRIYFVAKAEVASWPGIGWLARATGTVFIARKVTDAHKHRDTFTERLLAGHKLLFFPEGTSTDALRVLRFKSTLFAAFLTEKIKPEAWVQPVSVVYTAPEGAPVDFYGWWGDMSFGPHMLKVLAARKAGSVKVIYHPPYRAADYDCRKKLAADCEAAVRSGVEKTLGDTYAG